MSRQRSTFRAQRCLMDGGTCEATAFVGFGYRAAGYVVCRWATTTNIGPRRRAPGRVRERERPGAIGETDRGGRGGMAGGAARRIRCCGVRWFRLRGRAAEIDEDMSRPTICVVVGWFCLPPWRARARARSRRRRNRFIDPTRGSSCRHRRRRSHPTRRHKASSISGWVDARAQVLPGRRRRLSRATSAAHEFSRGVQ